MQKFFRRTLTALLIVSCVLTTAIVGATVKLYTASGEGYCYESESQDIAKQRAVDKAIKKATKQAGVYLKTYSRTVNSELTDDEVLAITSNAWQLVGEPKFTRELINHSGDTQIIVWTATVEVNVDDSEIQSWIKRDDQNKSQIISQTREALKASAENDRKVEDLREKYNRATSQSERDSIIKQMKDVDRYFLANKKFEDAMKLYYAKDYEGTIKLYDEAIDLNPSDDWSYNNRGIVYYLLGQKERAIQDYDKAIQFNPYDEKYYDTRGNAYNELGQYERAIQDFNKAIELNPNLAQAYYNRGNAYVYLDQYERAIRDFNKVIELPDFAGGYNFRGLAYDYLGDFEHEKSNYDKAGEQYEHAIINYEKAIQLNPNNADYYYNRGNTYFKLGRYKGYAESWLRPYENAILDYSKVVQFNPKDADAYNNRGVAYNNLRQYEQAIQDFDKVIQLDPNYAMAYNNRGFAYGNLDQYEQAIKDFDKAIQLNPNYSDSYRNRALNYMLLGNFKQAIQDLDKAIQLNSNGVEGAFAYQLRGRCYQKLGDNEKAKADFAKAKELGYKG